MRRRQTTLKAKSGGVQNGNGAGHPRALIDLAMYYERRAHVVSTVTVFDPAYSGNTNPSRPRNYAITLRRAHPGG
jgi:hypothetical protein